MYRGDRLNAILERLAQGGVVQIAELAKDLNVSPGTVRRDLRLLEEQKLLSRSHGGAVAHSVLYQLPVRYMADEYKEAKRNIARAAVRGVKPGQTVGLTGGTTTTEVARALVGIDRITVVTNALNIAGELAVRPSVKLVVTGGVCRTESYELVGPLAESKLEDVWMDVVIAGIHGITASRGASVGHELEAQTTRAMMRSAGRTVIVADGSKVGRVSFARLCDVSEIDEFVTDASATGSALTALKQSGLKVTIAPES